MTMKGKGTIIILTLIFTICAFAFLGFREFVKAIRNQRTCEWANIDNIELHAHVDIPKVTKWDCNYEKESNTKKASFTIDINHIDLNYYIQTYHLKKWDSATEPEYNRFLNLKKDSLNTSDLYYKNSSLDGERYDVLLDKKTARIWVTIKYKD